MKISRNLLLVLAIGQRWITSGAASDIDSLPPIETGRHLDDEKVHNANHIFNAIRGAMRQWDSSWNHNGMSFFLASVPENTQFYHGTHTPDVVTGREWLAFEPEHALGFARPRGPRRPPGDGKDPPRRPPGFDEESRPPPEHTHHNDGRKILHDRFYGHGASNGAQRILHAYHDDLHKASDTKGYLHVYRTKHKLDLLLIDGMSAGKTDQGTLDSQDYILLLGKYIDKPWQDWERASGLCNLTRDAWNSKIDGFIRMEAGFEIILCNFSAHLNIERVQPVEADKYDPGNGRGPFMSDQFRFYRAVADRFRGIGGNRMSVDYASLVSAYTSDIDLYKDHALLPRLRNVSQDMLDPIRDATTQMVKSSDRKPTHDWQSIADEFVQRYAVPLQYLVSPFFNDLKSLQSELQSLLTPFIINSDRDESAETRRCVQQFLPPDYNQTLSGRVVNAVGEMICSTLLSAMDSNDFAMTQGRIKYLVQWLDWPVWKECPTCELDKVCVLPIWPISGSAKDREQPTCQNRTEFADGGRDYWGIRPGPGPPP